ncbi:hypothetical protein BDW69DRAFT_178681 [Aspergillus filifer]
MPKDSWFQQWHVADCPGQLGGWGLSCLSLYCAALDIIPWACLVVFYIMDPCVDTSF